MSMKVNKNGKEYDLGFVPQSLYDDVTELKSAIFPTGYSDDGLTFTDCTWVSGGYNKVGNLVFISVRIVVTATSTVAKKYIELPNDIKPMTLTSLIAQNISDDETPIYSVASGNGIYIKNAVTNKTYTISGTWLA